jgi:WD40 repeat protein
VINDSSVKKILILVGSAVLGLMLVGAGWKLQQIPPQGHNAEAFHAVQKTLGALPRVYDSKESNILKNKQNSVWSVNFSPNGQTLASGGSDGTIKLWKHDGSPITTIKTEQNSVISVNFNPDGQTLVSGGSDGTVKLWQRDGSPIITIKTEQSTIWSVNFSPDGQTLVSGGSDGTIKLWKRNGSPIITIQR